MALGFNQIGITDTNLQAAEAHHQAWIAKGFHGEMDYMAKHGLKRTRPEELVPRTLRVISARLDYLPANALASEAVLKLQKLSEKIAIALEECEQTDFSYRVFTDSAPVLEVALAEKAGMGWRGKHTLLINKDHGSWFFLGEIYTNLPLPVDAPGSNHCGTCQSCIDVCPTRAIVAPYQVDARRCISYLTIELKGSIPLEFRPMIGNRVYGCDDFQLACPWNKFAEVSHEPDFVIKHGLDDIGLVDCFAWTEAEFNSKLAGSAIYRIGYQQWLRNIAVGLGNAKTSPEIIKALQARANDESALLREHVLWALAQHLH